LLESYVSLSSCVDGSEHDNEFRRRKIIHWWRTK